MLEKNQDGSYEIDISALFKALWRKIWIILIATVICGAAFFAYAQFRITPQYSASTMLYVNSGSISLGSYKLSTTDMSTGSQLVTRYRIILGSNKCLEQIKNAANLKYKTSQLKGMISAEAVEETEIFQVTVTSSDPKEAALIANTISKVLPSVISDIITETTVKVVDNAVENDNPVSPNKSKYLITGLIIGLLISSIIIIVLELLDDIIHSEEYITENYKDIPFLAAIPDLTTKNDRVYYRYGTKNAQLGSYRAAYASAQVERKEEGKA